MKITVALLISSFLVGIGAVLSSKFNNETGVSSFVLPEGSKTNLLSAQDLENLQAAPSLQDRLDTIVKALKHLPPGELKRLGVDLSSPILSGTEEADKLFNAWKTRQEELKSAMGSMLKPAEYMANLSQLLKPDSLATIPEKVQHLIDLESLMEDIDNARDFHTIGAWPGLVELLTPNQPLELRSQAAWVIGTAVKNDYDYQLWVLENITVTSDFRTVGNKSKTNQNFRNISCLELLLIALDHSFVPDNKKDELNFHQMIKHTLYALSSGIRGNIDVQNAVLSILKQDLPSESTKKSNDDSRKNSQDEINAGLNLAFFKNMEKIIVSNKTTPDVMRKVWSLFSDLLDERFFIRQELTTYALEKNGLSPSKLTEQNIVSNGKNSEDVFVIDFSDLDGVKSTDAINNEKVEGKTENDETLAVISAVEEIQHLDLIGDYLLHPSWVKISVDVLQYYTSDLISYIPIVNDITDVEEKNVLTSKHATIRSLLITLKEIIRQVSKEDLKQLNPLLDILKIQGTLILSSFKDFNQFEDIIELSEEIVLFLS